MSKKTILFISGVPDEVTSEEYSKATDPYPKGNLPLYPYFSEDEFHKFHILLNADEAQKVTLPEFDAVFNLITNPYTHHKTLLKVDSLYQKFKDKTVFFNAPPYIASSRQTALHETLSDIENLHIPHTVRLSPQSIEELAAMIDSQMLHYPLVLKNEKDGHQILLGDKEDIPENLLCNQEEIYRVSSFIPYLLNGYYRKERLVVIGGEVFLADVCFSDRWDMDEAYILTSPETDKMRQSISRRFDTEIKPFIQATIEKIYQRIQLDFFTMDCHIDADYSLYLFKLNPDINLFAINRDHPFIEQLMYAHKRLTGYVSEKMTNSNH
jgi:hypothetical protein